MDTMLMLVKKFYNVTNLDALHVLHGQLVWFFAEQHVKHVMERTSVLVVNLGSIYQELIV
jgi:hypothetical protein